MIPALFPVFGSGVDPFWSSVVLLCPFEGANGDTNSTNVGSLTGATNWYTAPTTLTNTQKPYGNTSFPCTASHGLYYGVPTNGSHTWTPHTSDFTMDGYFRPSADASGNNTLFSIRPAQGTSGDVTDFIEVQHHSTYRIGMELFGNNHSETTDSANNALVVDTWQHVALVRASSVTKIYVGGVEVCTHADANDYSADTTARFSVGCSGYNLSQAFVGFLKDMRYTLAARWTSAFTPPAGPFPTS